MMVGSIFIWEIIHNHLYFLFIRHHFPGKYAEYCRN